MNASRGYFFVPAVDLGIVYSGFQVELMKCMLPQHMHRDVICFNRKKWTASELVDAYVVDIAVGDGSSSSGSHSCVLKEAIMLAKSVESKGMGKARRALAPIKRKLHAKLLAVLQNDVKMGFSGRSAGDHYAPPESRL